MLTNEEKYRALKRSKRYGNTDKLYGGEHMKHKIAKTDVKEDAITSTLQLQYVR